MYACPRCGKKTAGDYWVWKGGINRALCENCKLEERRLEEQLKKEEKGERDS